MNFQSMQKYILKILFVVQISILAGCSQNNLVYHGYTFNDVRSIDERLQNLKSNHVTKDKVINLLGSPTFTEDLKNNQQQSSQFFYVEDTFLRKPFIGDRKISTKVLKICFDSHNRVDEIKFYNVEGEEIFDTSTKTKVKGGEMNILEQMKRNFTRISKK